MRALVRFIGVGFTSAVVACGGGASESVHVATPVSSGIPHPVAEPPAAQPASLALWVHVAQPARLGALAQDLAAPEKTPSCAKGDVTACLALIDPSRPVDFAIAGTDAATEAEATAFSVESVASFLDRAKTSFPAATEVRRGIVRLQPKVLCDVGHASRVVCGSERGLAVLAPWLRSEPHLATTGIARAKVFAGPLLAAADKELAGDDARNQSLRLLAHDFAGASIELTAGDAPNAPIALDVEMNVQNAQSPWTRVLLAPGASSAAVPEAFGRLSADATAVFFAPGGGALGALLDQLGSFAALASTDAAKVPAVIAELHGVLGRPVVCAHAIDFDEARAAVARTHHVPEKDRKKAEAALDAAFGSYLVCGVEEPIAAAEKLARKLVALAPKDPNETVTIRSGASFGLPRGAFVLESVDKKKPSAPKTTDTLVVPDGNVTWIVSGDDPRLGVQFTKRLLARPKGALPGLDAPAEAILTGSVTALFGAFAWDLAMRSYDAVEKSLAAGSTASPGRLHIALAHRGDGSAGTISLRLASDRATIKALSLRAMPVALMMGALLFASSSKNESHAP